MMAVIDYHHDEMFRGISPYHVITTLAQEPIKFDGLLLSVGIYYII